MHRELRALLTNAVGSSEHVIAILIDIRGFSSFCKELDSFDVANYVKRIYMEIIDNYFNDASFYKPTGDGLLVIISCADKPIKKTINSVIERCIKLLQTFEHLCDDDELINFEVPNKIGIGISRGTACKIVSNSKTLDYSGRVINLAARLMNLARPLGIVFDSSLGFKLIKDEIKENFLNERIYIRGISEDTPIEVCYTRNFTILNPANKKPIKEPEWKSEKRIITVSYIRTSPAKSITLLLPKKVHESKKIYFEITTPRVDEKGALLWQFDTDTKGIKYEEIGKTAQVSIDKGLLLKLSDEVKLKDDAEITLVVSYISG